MEPSPSRRVLFGRKIKLVYEFAVKKLMWASMVFAPLYGTALLRAAYALTGDHGHNEDFVKLTPPLIGSAGERALVMDMARRVA